MADPVVPPVVPPVVVPPVVVPPTPWTNGVDPGLVAHWQIKGYDISSPDKVAIAASKAHMEAERFIGAPSNELLRIPKDTDEAGKKAFWSRLGTPADAAGYDFSTLKDAGGKALVSDALADALRGIGAATYTPKDTITRIAGEIVKFNQSQETARIADQQAKIDVDRVAIKKDWGVNFDANLFIAKQAAAKLGFTEEAVNALQNVAGYKAVMTALHNVGTKIGEDKFVSLNGAVPGVLTKTQAQAKRSELMGDNAWKERYLKGGTAEARELMALNTIIVGDDTENSRSR